jgi:hypothetical protein
MPNSLYTAHATMCPNRAQWLRYRRGQSNAIETSAIETHFTHCPLCSEAVETIMQTEPDVLQAAWEQMPNEFAVPPAPIKKAAVLTYYIKQFSVAAAIVACLMGGYLLYTKTSQQQTRPVALNKSSQKKNEQIPHATSAPANVNTTPPNVSPPANIKQAQPIKKEQTIAENKRLMPSASIEINKTVSNKALIDTKEEVKDLVADYTAAAPVAEAELAPQPMLEKAGKKERLAVTADNYASAAQLNVKTNSATELYLAEQYKACIPLFENNIKESNTLGQNALYLADAYQKTGNKRAARKLLQQIIAQNGPNAKQAQQMLDLLEKK